jgi:hypothetical protein
MNTIYEFGLSTEYGVLRTEYQYPVISSPHRSTSFKRANITPSQPQTVASNLAYSVL